MPSPQAFDLAIIFTEHHAFIFRQENMTGITFGQHRNHLNDAWFSFPGDTEILWIADDDIREVGRVQMTAFALDINSTRLLHHAIVVVNVLRLDSADIVQALFELNRRDRFCDKFLPATAMNENAL